MRYCVIHGSPRKGNTCGMERDFRKKLMQADPSAEFEEFFLAKDGPGFCTGCFGCILRGEETCPHRQAVRPILASICSCDGLIVTSPVYVRDCTAQMKALLDHLPYLYMIHRPRPELFRKSAVILSTAAGDGTKDVIGTIRRSLEMWGISRIHSMGVSVFAEGWDAIPEKRMKQIEQKLDKMAQRFAADCKKGPGLPAPKIWFWFQLSRWMNRKGMGKELDRSYWEAQGWTGKKRPWKG